MIGLGERRGTSPLVGVVLLVAIVVLLAVTVASMAAGLVSTPAPAPTFVGEASTEFVVGPDGAASQNLRIEHVAGEGLPVEDVQVQLDGGGQTSFRQVPATGDLADGEWRAGEVATVPLDTDAVCSGGDDLEVRVVYDTEHRSAVLAEHSVPIRHSSFDIASGVVRPKHEYAANVTVVGTGFTYGTGGERIDIAVRPRVGGTTLSPWGSNVNDGGNPRDHEITSQSAGTGIAVTAEAKAGEYTTAWGSTGNYPGATASSTADAGGRVRTLRDGDPVPEVEGMGDQSTVASYVDEYVADGEIDLAPNQAIFLFELGATNPDDPGFDLQDVVVLVSMWSERSSAVYVEEPSGGVVCPD